MIFWRQRLQDMPMTFKYLLRIFAIDPSIFCLDRKQKRPSEKLAIMMLYIFLLLFAWSFNQFAIFFHTNFFLVLDIICLDR